MDLSNPIITDREAQEGQDAKSLADRALVMAALYGKESRDMLARIFVDRRKDQAISLLIEAARTVEADAYSLTDDTLRLLDMYRRAHCDDHERLAEIGEAMAEIWTRVAEDERERCDD